MLHVMLQLIYDCTCTPVNFLPGNCSYGDAVQELDYGVGVILKQLKTLGVDRDTLVIFSSDNGAATYDKARGIYSCLLLQ